MATVGASIASAAAEVDATSPRVEMVDTRMQPIVDVARRQHTPATTTAPMQRQRMVEQLTVRPTRQQRTVAANMAAANIANRSSGN